MPPEDEYEGAETSFNLSNRFFIDDGELKGLTPEFAFMLGVEWEMVRGELIKDRGEFKRPIHSQNLDRLLKLAWSLKRRTEHEVLGEGWVHLTVLRA